VTLGAATEKGAGDHEEHCDNEASVDKEAGHLTDTTPPRPNGSRLSCGRNAGGRKAAEPPIEPAGEGTEFFAPERPTASSAC